MGNPVGWFEIYVADMARATQFYETVLAVSLEDIADPEGGDIDMKGFPADMTGYGASGALVKMDGVDVGQNSVMVYFSCEDCAIEEARVEAAGGRLEKAKFSIGEHGFVSVAVDSEGNVFGLHSNQ